MNSIDLNSAATRVASSLAVPSTLVSRSAQEVAGTRPRGVSTAAPATGTTTGSGASSTPASNQITSNDFLTLLVTEMKNQDPTQPTDPNAYIQQLVSVNSLQQLIAINNDLTPPATGSGSGSGAGQTGAVMRAIPPAASVLLPTSNSSVSDPS